ncbi:EAL domain-containing protein, partial [Ruminococcaceae bacterium OttesenSCG-928-O06]|nr:EAL domain-containing protein [Ruminococcaceae bacterium OttesenSCG-928-O06]
MKTQTETRNSKGMLRLFGRLQGLNEQRHLYSIRTAFISTMPIMIMGAYATLLNQLPIAAYQGFMEDVFGPRWRMFGELAFYGTTQIATLMVVFLICRNLVQWYNANRNTQAHSGICGTLGLACYVIMALPVAPINPEPDQLVNSLPFSITGVTGLFVGIVVAVVASELFIHTSSNRRTLQLLSDDPNVAVPQSFASVWPVVFIIVGFVALRVLLVRFVTDDGLSAIVNDFLRRPYESASDSMGTAVLYNISSHIMWLFGIHGNNVLDGVAQSVFVPAMSENVAAHLAGQAAPNLITKTLFDAFVYMGGSGTTLALLLALLIFGRGRSYRTLMRYALPNSLFNINEPLIFGIPIVLNPVYAIPFVATPVVMFGTTALAMTLGLVPYTVVEVSWATPVFISGYIATQSFAGVMLQVVNLAIAVLIYAPFVRLAERMSQIRFERAYKDLAQIIVTEYSPTSRKLIHRVDEVGAVARSLANQMDRALVSGEMFLNYQPIVDARDNTLHSVEALLRWKHPQHGFINPMVTIAIAEETGRIDNLGLWIMDQAVLQRAKWTQQGLPAFHVAVNVSSQQLNDAHFCVKVMDKLRHYNVPPDQLQVEITETVALVENDATRDNLQKLSE